MIIGLLFYGIILSFLALFVRKKYNFLRWIIFSFYIFLTLFLTITIGKDSTYFETFNLISILNFDLSLNFRITPLGWLFTLFTTLLLFLTSIFSIVKNKNEDAERLINFFWFILIISNTGLFLADDLFTLFIFWELIGISSYFVISPGWVSSFRAVNYYFIFSIICSFFMFSGIMILYEGTGTFSIQKNVLYFISLFENSPLNAIFVAISLIIGFFVKSALFPFHIWPAQAHAKAPDDFSSVLSGIIIKYGLYRTILFFIPLFLFIKEYPVNHIMVNNIPLFSHILAWSGAITSIIATFLAIESNDMKKLAAYSTVANMGYITTALFSLSSFGIAGAIFHTINHAIFKTAIFLSIAAVKYRTHETQMHKLGGMAYKMPVTFLTFLLAIISAAGIPPLNGYVSKWMIYQGLLSSKFPFLTLAIFLSSTGAFMYLFRALHSIFLGQLPEKFDNVKEVPFLMQIPMYILMFLMVSIGIFPQFVINLINSVLTSYNISNINIKNSMIFSPLSGIDSVKVFLAFTGSFILAFILYLIGKPRKHVQPLDTYTAGQDPADFNLTRELYHFAYKFYGPFEHMFDSFRTDTKEFYDSIERKINEIGGYFRDFQSGSIRGTIYTFMLSFVLIIIYWWLL